MYTHNAHKHRNSLYATYNVNTLLFNNIVRIWEQAQQSDSINQKDLLEHTTPT